MPHVRCCSDSRLQGSEGKRPWPRRACVVCPSRGAGKDVILRLPQSAVPPGARSRGAAVPWMGRRGRRERRSDVGMGKDLSGEGEGTCHTAAKVSGGRSRPPLGRRRGPGGPAQGRAGAARPLACFLGEGHTATAPVTSAFPHGWGTQQGAAGWLDCWHPAWLSAGGLWASQRGPLHRAGVALASPRGVGAEAERGGRRPVSHGCVLEAARGHSVSCGASPYPREGIRLTSKGRRIRGCAGMVLTTVVFLEGCGSDVVKGRQERKRKAGGGREGV